MSRPRVRVAPILICSMLLSVARIFLCAVLLNVATAAPARPATPAMAARSNDSAAVRSNDSAAVRSNDSGAVRVNLLWLRVVPDRPRVIYVGGTLDCVTDPIFGSACHPWMMRSTDGGDTWADLSLRLASGNGYEAPALSPLILEPDGRDLYFDRVWHGGTPAGSGLDLLRSSDAGLDWTSSGYTEQYGGGVTALALSPLSARRLYAVHDAGEGEGGYVQYSNDGGATWRPGAPLTASGSGYFYAPPWGGLVADPARPDTVYANLYATAQAYFAGQPLTTVERSDDAGLNWSQVVTPTTSPPLHSFVVGTGRYEGALLVGRTLDKTVPADHRYLSGDEGRTWITATCPGDWHGVCPRFTLDNVFGAGASYGILPSGVDLFHGAAPATRFLPGLTARLPLRPADLLDAEGGSRARDPVYLLGKGTRGNVRGVLYRSDDGGATCQQLAPGVLPNLAPPSLAVDTLYVPATNHSVAAPFMDSYTATSRYILGDPVTEAYTEGDTLTQDFDHMSLQLRGGRVVAGDLGAQVSAGQFAARTAPPMPPDLRHFWLAHGGAALLGMPISPIVYGSNGDGSGRKYFMLWCQNARLERHPELHDPHFSILLSLLGRDALRERGWLPSS